MLVTSPTSKRSNWWRSCSQTCRKPQSWAKFLSRFLGRWKKWCSATQAPLWCLGMTRCLPNSSSIEICGWRTRSSKTRGSISWDWKAKIRSTTRSSKSSPLRSPTPKPPTTWSSPSTRSQIPTHSSSPSRCWPNRAEASFRPDLRWWMRCSCVWSVIYLRWRYIRCWVRERCLIRGRMSSILLRWHRICVRSALM